VKINCTYKELLPISQLSIKMTEKLKIRTKQSVNEEARRLLLHGFLTPIFVWKNNQVNEVVDGVGRCLAIKAINDNLIGLNLNGELENNLGEEVKEAPVVYIESTSLEEAKKKVLLVNSMFGKIDKDTLEEYSKLSGDSVDYINCHTTFFEYVNEVEAEMPEISLDSEWLNTGYEPKIGGHDISEEDISKAEKKITEIVATKEKEYVTVTCHNCGHIFTVGK